MVNKKNYNKISTEVKVAEPVTDSVSFEQVETPPVEVVEEPKAKTGVVANCNKLNVRKDAKADAAVARIIDAGTKVTIMEEVGGFYKIGDSEYCMKKFIRVK